LSEELPTTQATNRVQAALSRHLGRAVVIRSITPLAGGACQENLRVDLEIDGTPATWVLRSDAAASLPGSIGRAAEYAVIQAAVAAGAPTPPVRWLSPGLLRAGADAYFMEWRDGEAVAARVLRRPELAEARRGLIGELVGALAAIHSIGPETRLPLAAIEATPAADAVAGLRALLDGLASRPALELALRWLAENTPPCPEVTLLHGDFRVGNFLVTPQGLSAVLDWEFSRWGDPHEDLSWFCVRDWRFGSVTRPAGGLTDRATLARAYTAASGRAIDPARLHYWEVLGNVRWGVCALFQGERYLSGSSTDIELLAIPRRAAEMAYEALRLIEVGPTWSARDAA